MEKKDNIQVSIEMDSEKLETLNVYLAKENINLEESLTEGLEDLLDKIYMKNVPLQVREFLALKSGEPLQSKEKAPRRERKNKLDEMTGEGSPKKRIGKQQEETPGMIDPMQTAESTPGLSM
ncbi:DUF6103 family protein [Diplocloster hominis]|uniref:DUF6103 family protein n=1 Tax=Diplocloster hominis TaxID=3079010 RepID=UPI0031BB17F8